MDEPSVRQWANAYARAWEHSDPEAVVALFTPNASYRSLIFSEPHLGTDGIRAYWERATATQGDVHVWMGDPLVDGERATLEWWTIMNEEDEGPITLPGCLLGTPGPMVVSTWCRAGSASVTDAHAARVTQGATHHIGTRPRRSRPNPPPPRLARAPGWGEDPPPPAPFRISSALRNQTCERSSLPLERRL